MKLKQFLKLLNSAVKNCNVSEDLEVVNLDCETPVAFTTTDKELIIIFNDEEKVDNDKSYNNKRL